MKKLWMVVLIAAPLFIQSVSAKPDPVVATVNGKNIKKSIFDETYQQNLLFVSDKPVTKEKVLNDLIHRELGIMRARKNGLDSDPVVKRKMEDILYHAMISKDLEPKLKKIVVTDKDVKSYYGSNPEIRTAHILFRMRATPQKKESDEALKAAMKVYKTAVKNPDKFAELANKFSQSSTAPNGGDMGYQPVVRLAPEYFDAIKGKKQGFISAPTRTQFGYHVIKVLGIKDFKAANMALYKKVVYDRKRDKILAKYFKDLKKSAAITVQKKYLKH
ncbi:MAG: hypothetical protein HN509_10365 [Halobacteriovoraceae bacterium]|jgi:parvulin-like peptidyl-prolyl isomerase|nr:hypothetical protein [Halobacteriovoraceae bacterium]